MLTRLRWKGSEKGRKEQDKVENWGKEGQLEKKGREDRKDLFSLYELFSGGVYCSIGFVFAPWFVFKLCLHFMISSREDVSRGML